MLHWAFDTVAGCLAILYVRDFLLREVEHWRQRKRADIEMERIAANANAALAIVFEHDAYVCCFGNNKGNGHVLSSGWACMSCGQHQTMCSYCGKSLAETERGQWAAIRHVCVEKAGSAGATTVSHATSVDDKGILSCAADPKEP